jgi:hypothetical protein
MPAANLKELVLGQNHHGFRLRVGYYAKIDHGLMGYHPIIEVSSREPVITTNLEILRTICLSLPPKTFKICTQLIYCSKMGGVAYSILGATFECLEKATPYKITTQEYYDYILRTCEQPFGWAPGVLGADIDQRFWQEIVDRKFAEAAKAIS